MGVCRKAASIGRLAQRERRCLTSTRSGVQIPHRPPLKTRPEVIFTLACFNSKPFMGTCLDVWLAVRRDARLRAHLSRRAFGRTPRRTCAHPRTHPLRAPGTPVRTFCHFCANWASDTFRTGNPSGAPPGAGRPPAHLRAPSGAPPAILRPSAFCARSMTLNNSADYFTMIAKFSRHLYRFDTCTPRSTNTCTVPPSNSSRKSRPTNST